MKSVLKNKKGFTLIELLAVIVILAILVMVAIPAVTRYLNSARQGTFADNAKSAISAVRNDVIMNGYGSKNYSIDDINQLLEKKLQVSPFGGDKGKYVGYNAGSWSDTYTGSMIVVTQTEDTDATGKGLGTYTYKYEMCLFDEAGRGFQLTEENAINSKVVELNAVTTCS